MSSKWRRSDWQRPLQFSIAETDIGRCVRHNDLWAPSSFTIGFFGSGPMVSRRKTRSNIQHPGSCTQEKISTKASSRSRICDFDRPRNGLEGKISAKVGLHIHIQECGHAGAVRDNFLLSTPHPLWNCDLPQGNGSPTAERTPFLVLRFRTIKNTFWRPCLVSDGVEVLRNEIPKREQIYRGSKKLQIGYSAAFFNLAT